MSNELPKKRIPLTEAERADILFASDDTCCKCRIPHRPLQIHHIDGDRSNKDPSNLAVLCLECHHETQVQGGFARALTPDLVRIYRDDWQRRVQENRSRRAGAVPGAYATAAFGAVPFIFAVNSEGKDLILTIALLAALVILAILACRAYASRRA